MLIVLLRHGVAEEKGTKPDAERRLTEEGNREMERVANSLARLLPDAGAIYSSPLVRARETAEWVAKAYGGRMDVRTTPALLPDAGAGDFRELLHEVDAGCAYFAGHESHLTDLMLELTGMQTDGELSLKKGGCYGLELKSGKSLARLRLMLAPHLMP